MKKLLPALVVLGLLAYGGFAFHASRSAEDAYHRAVYSLSRHPGVRLLDSGYTRGWSRSTAVTAFELTGPAGQAFGERLRRAGVEGARHRVGFRLEHRVLHGPLAVLGWARAGAEGSPVVAVVDTTARFDRESEIELRQAFGDPPPLEIHARVRLSGVGEARLAAPAQPLRALPPQPGLAAWQGVFHGLSGDAVFTSDALSLAGSFESDGLEGGSGPEGFAVRHLTIGLDLHRSSPDGPWSGHLDLEAGRVELEGGAVVLHELRLVEERGRRPAGPTRTVHVGLDAIALAAGRRLGPGRMELVVRGADDAPAPGAHGGEPADEPPVGQALAPLGGPGSVIELRALELDLPEGRLEARGRLAPSASPAPAAALLAPLAGVDLALEARAPEALLGDLASSELRDGVAALRRHGLVRVEEGVVELRLELRGGVLRAHGEVVPIEDLFGVPVLADASPAAGRSGAAQGR